MKQTEDNQTSFNTTTEKFQEMVKIKFVNH